MAPTPKSNHSTPCNSKSHYSRTPMPKRLNFPKEHSATLADHPVEVIGRIRNQPESKTSKTAPAPATPSSALHIDTDGKSVRVKTEIGYRDFSLDGVSSSEEDDLEGFYKRFVESRIHGVQLGNKCTIMMYGPTGSGKSHTMFGCPKQPGIVYKSLKDILGEGDGERMGVGTFVHVTVLEIYNEEIYDLLSTGNAGGFTLGWPKAGGSASSKVRLEVMGKKAKNATFISGNEAGKILKEIQKVEKRRIVKSTLCNERSSRSHCMIIIDVPTVGGQLLLVDMAGSENIEQAGQNGFEAKMQTAKINQGNIALKRVVESIANGDSHVPFRDSKLTMLLQDSFEDDKSKILMILCASPDPKELHKTIATLEYGAKAKCIVRGPHTPVKEKGGEDSAVILGSRITALDNFICKLQIENKIKAKECNEAQKELKDKEVEVAALRTKLASLEGRGTGTTEEEINLKVSERLKIELERKVKECEKMANDIVEMERKKMEEKMLKQQQEMEMLRRRLEEIESELRLSRGESVQAEAEVGSSFMQRLLQAEDSDMVMSMDLDKSIDLETNVVVHGSHVMSGGFSYTNNFRESIQNSTPTKACLTTVYEEDECENEEDEKENSSDEEVQKEVIEEKKIIVTPKAPAAYSSDNGGHELYNDTDACKDASLSREKTIHNIHTLCGIYSEPRQHNGMHANAIQKTSDKDSKQNFKPLDENGEVEVSVKWEGSEENPGKFITILNVANDSTLADLRKLIEIYLGADQHPFSFVVLGDPSGAPVPKEKETTIQAIKLPVFNSISHGHLASLRPLKPIVQGPTHMPFTPLENKLMSDLNSDVLKKSGDCFSPKITHDLNSTSPFTAMRQAVKPVGSGDLMFM